MARLERNLSIVIVCIPASRPLLQPAIDVISQQTLKYRERLFSSRKLQLTSRQGYLNQSGNEIELSFNNDKWKDKQDFGSKTSTKRDASAEAALSYQERQASEDRILPERGQELV